MEAFVVNLKGGKLIRTQIQVEFSERDIPKRFYTKLVPIRDGIISILTERTAEDLTTAKGKESLKVALKDLINETMHKQEAKNIYFTQFVVQ